jgi:hypothetical protein
MESDLRRMRVSIDFTMPDKELGSHVPISVLPKWPPLYRFDFQDSEGNPVPLLTSEENGDIDEALLKQIVEDLSPASLKDSDFCNTLHSLTCGPETDLVPIFEEFVDGLQIERFDRPAERLVELAALLTDTTLLWYPVDRLKPDVRTVAKLEYIIRTEPGHGFIQKVARSLSWHQPPEYFFLWHAGADANFHVDVEVPPTLMIRDAEPGYLRYIPAWLDEAVAEEEEKNSVIAEKKGVRPDQFLDVSGRLAHLYISGRRPLAADLLVRFAATRTGMVLSSFLASVLIAILVTAFYKWRHWAGESTHVGASVSVLILIPALIGYLVVRSTDHPMVRRYIVGIQVVAAASAAVPLAMSVLLIRFAEDPSCLHQAWHWAVYISWVLAAILLVGLVGAGRGLSRRGNADDHGDPDSPGE